MKPDFILCVTSLTYNHSLYITDALNGFTMQKTNFPFVVLLIDDASTDGTQEIIRTYVNKNFDVADPDVAYERDTEYANITYAQHKDNRNCYIVVHYLKYNHYQVRKNKVLYLTEWKDRVKYEALCEGDDYWTDPFKLQKQVDFLETNPDYSMCFHNALEHYEHKNVLDKYFSNVKDKDYNGKYILKKWIIPTASVLYRKQVTESDLYKKVLQCKYFIYGDTPLFVTCSEIGKIRGMSDAMSVYRRNAGGMTQQKISIESLNALCEHLKAFNTVFGRKYFCLSNFLAARLLIRNLNYFRRTDKIGYNLILKKLSSMNLIFVVAAFCSYIGIVLNNKLRIISNE